MIFEKFDMINTKSVYHYEDLFSAEIEGITTFLVFKSIIS
jgi:hypothetical protein